MAIAPDLFTDGAAMPDASELLAQLGDGDPRMAALCRFFVQRQATLAAEAPAEHAEDDDAPANDRAALHALQSEHERLRRTFAAMRRDLRALRDHNAMLAAALGACEACWGRDPACAHCAGRGRPGAESPDVALYARLVAPAVRRLRFDEGVPPVFPASHPDRAVGGPSAGPLD